MTKYVMRKIQLLDYRREIRDRQTDKMTDKHTDYSPNMIRRTLRVAGQLSDRRCSSRCTLGLHIRSARGQISPVKPVSPGVAGCASVG